MTALLALAIGQTGDIVRDPRELLPFGYAPVSAEPDPVSATLTLEPSIPDGQTIAVTMMDRDSSIRPPAIGGGIVAVSSSKMLNLMPDVCTASNAPWIETQARLTSAFFTNVTAAGGSRRTLEVVDRVESVEDTPFPIESIRYVEVSDGANDFEALASLGDPNRVRLTSLTRIERRSCSRSSAATSRASRARSPRPTACPWWRWSKPSVPGQKPSLVFRTPSGPRRVGTLTSLCPRTLRCRG